MINQVFRHIHSKTNYITIIIQVVAQLIIIIRNKMSNITNKKIIKNKNLMNSNKILFKSLQSLN
jgi:hypothetical protein